MAGKLALTAYLLFAAAFFVDMVVSVNVLHRGPGLPEVIVVGAAGISMGIFVLYMIWKS